MRSLIATLIFTASLAVPSARAAQSYDNCTGFVDTLPAVISTQGTWCLRQDASTAITTGAAIEINANNVTLDCNDFKLGGLAAGMGTVTIGVLANGRSNITIRNCSIRGFHRGITLLGAASGHVIERNRIDGTTSIAVFVIGDNTLVRDNFIVDTGGSTRLSPGPDAYGVYVAGDNVNVLDNTIAGVTTAVSGYDTVGIYLYPTGSGNMTAGRNRLQGIGDGGVPTATGILAFYGRAIIHDNVLHGPPSPNQAWGVSCVGVSGIAMRNTIVGFNYRSGGCLPSDEVIE